MGKVLFRCALFLSMLIGASFCVHVSHASITFIPGATIELTGSSNGVYFDVEDDIMNALTIVSPPKLTTATRKFTGAFYLSGAGWVDLGAPGYDVFLDCGAQSIDSLTDPCEVTGTGYSEIIGDILFSDGVLYYPNLGYLSGEVSTFLGDYSFDKIYLPLRPALLREGTGSVAHHLVSLSVSGSQEYGNGAWTIGFTPQGTFARRDRSPLPNFALDLSLSANYDVEIRDPQGSITRFVYQVDPNIPSFSLYGGAFYRNDFCISFPIDARCQDGVTQKPSEITGTTGPKVANAQDQYSIGIKFRDTYGNEVNEGDISLMYRDTIRTFQVDSMEYINFSDYCARNIDNYCALITGGVLLSNDDGTPEIIHAPVLGGVNYTIASRAPSGASDVLSLSGISYRDADGTVYDIYHPSLAAPLVFQPWYTSSLTSGPITVGEVTEFTPSLVNQTPVHLPDSLLGIYHINIGTNSFSSYRSYLGENIACTKEVGSAGTETCDWVTTPDTSIISLWGSAFSGVYTPNSGHPGPENVSYQSYVRYVQGGTTIIYPSSSGNFGIANAGKEYIKILGQDTTIYGGISTDGSVGTNEWNTLKKNISLKSRGRIPETGYSDVDYTIFTGSLNIDNDDLHGAIPKNAIVVIGGDISISGAIQNGPNATVIIALMDESGSGGNIIIDPGVREIYSSLYAEKSIHSDGDNQLYIYGSVFSRNTFSDLKCPYYVTGVCVPELYNLENIRKDYLELADTTGHRSIAPRAQDYPAIPLIIEYDGRLMQQPPSILGK